MNVSQYMDLWFETFVVNQLSESSIEDMNITTKVSTMTYPKYTIDNVLQLLREKDMFDINEVETAIIESNGNLSILKKHNKNAVVVEDMGIVNKIPHITLPLIHRREYLFGCAGLFWT